MINLANVSAISKFVGFENTNEPVSVTMSTPAVLLGAGSSQSYTFTYTKDNTQSITRLRIKYVGVSSDWYQVEGYFSLFVAGISVTGNKDFPTIVSYSGDNLTITIYVVNTLGSAQTIPAQDYNITYRLFNTPS